MRCRLSSSFPTWAPVLGQNNASMALAVGSIKSSGRFQMLKSLRNNKTHTKVCVFFSFLQPCSKSIVWSSCGIARSVAIRNTKMIFPPYFITLSPLPPFSQINELSFASVVVQTSTNILALSIS